MIEDKISEEYLQESLTYTQDGRLIDSQGNAVMMDWEKPIMELSAKIICESKGKVLNVGFGLGLIDSEIQKYNVDEHWIIEAHPDVYRKMFQDGWHLKKNVKILLGDWRWYLQYLPKFDGIYIDTWDEEILSFHEYAPNILNQNGIYSFFNNPREDEDNLHMMKYEYDVINKNFDIDFTTMELEKIDDVDKQTKNGLFYWKPTKKTYYCPILKLKNNV